MKILAIETSCDETAIALLDITGPLEKPDIKVLGNSLLSQAQLHEEYGGVYPNLAKREHEKNLPILLAQTLKEAGENDHSPNIDYIAVTTGPGLEPALWTGITFAEDLGKKWGKSVISVNHMEGHIYSILKDARESLNFPALALLVSGGHTELVLIKGFGVHQILGRTLDDAVGEAFDKVARMLGLTYPGGPKISHLAEIDRQENPESVLTFPRPMIHSQDLNFSYSGLKTAVLYKIKAIGDLTESMRREVARAFEDAAVEVLVEKTRKAMEKNPEVTTLIVAGGVSANQYLVQEVSKLEKSYPHLSLRFPAPELSTDNAVMIGIAAFVKMSTKNDSLATPLVAKGNLTIS